MRRAPSIALALALVATLLSASLAQETQVVREAPRVRDPGEAGIDTLAPALDFVDTTGAAGTLAAPPGTRGLVVAFFSTTCPLSRKQAPALAELARSQRHQGITWLVVASAADDDAARLETARRELGLPGRLVPDPSLALARALGATSTTEVFLFDARRTLVYRGALDDQYGIGYALESPRHRYLAEALVALETRTLPAIRATTAPGCALDLATPAARPATEITWHNRIGRLADRVCATCHRDGEAAPFPLQTLADFRARRAPVRSALRRGLMPPWFAGESVALANPCRLSARERADFLAWLEAGLPEGDPADAGAVRTRTPGWSIPQADLVLTTRRTFEIPATGTIPYRETEIPTNLERDAWIQAIEVRPSSPTHVHHILVFLEFPRDHPRAAEQEEYDGGLKGYFAGMVPGQGTQIFPLDHGRFIPRGAILHLQIHYTATGEAGVDRPSIAFDFCDQPPAFEVLTLAASNRRFTIPPGAPAHPVEATLRFKRPGRLLTLMPHMHVRGAAFRYELERPDAGRELLLDVPRYDFNWQLEYHLADPLAIPAGARLHARALFDNSPANPANPDPTVEVRFGEQTWDEMMIGYVTLAYPAAALPPRAATPQEPESTEYF